MSSGSLLLVMGGSSDAIISPTVTKYELIRVAFSASPRLRVLSSLFKGPMLLHTFGLILLHIVLP